MTNLPFKTTGIYYRPKPKEHYNPSKVSRIWNIISNQPVLNGNVYDIIYFGELELPDLKEKTYYVGTLFNFLTHDFRESAKEYMCNTKWDKWENELYCYDFDFTNEEIMFENKIWKCHGRIIDSQINLQINHKESNKSFKDTFNYYIPSF